MERRDKDTNRTVYNELRRNERQRFSTEPSKVRTAEVVVPWIVSNVAAGSRLLDIAGGAGTYASEIVRAASITVVGVDISASMVAQRAEDPLLTENVVGDMESLPFEPATFDAAMFIACLHHIPDPYPALREAWRVLRAGGQVFAFEPSSARAKGAGNEPIPGHPHEFRMSGRWLARRVADAGFDIVELRHRQIAMRVLRRVAARPSLALLRTGDVLDGALRRIPGLESYGEIVMVRARKPQ